MLDRGLDRAVVEIHEELGLEVVLLAAGGHRVDGLLQRGVGHGRDEVGDRGGECAQLGECSPVRLGRVRERGLHHEDRPTVHPRRKEWCRWGGAQDDEDADAVGCLLGPAAEEVQRIPGPVGRVEHRAAGDRLVKPVQSVAERGDDAEVAASTAQRPHQVWMLVVARREPVPGTGHEVGGEEGVTGQPEPAGDPAEPAAQGEAREPGVGHRATRGGQPDLLGRLVEFAPDHPGSGDRGRAPGSTRTPFIGPRSNDDAVVARGQACRVVSPAAHRDQHFVLTRIAMRRHDVGRVGAAGDEGRILVDVAVPDPAGLVVAV